MEEIGQTTQVEQGADAVSQTEPNAISLNPEELQKEIARKEAVLLDTKRELKEARKRIPKEEFDTLHKRIEGMEEFNASMMDYLVDHLGEGEVEKPTRTTYSQQLKEKRATTPNLPPDPEVRGFINYLQSQGLTTNDSVVQDAMADDRSPQEALKYLKGKVDEKGEVDVAEKVRLAVEQKLKEMGVTAGGADAPSAPSGKVFTEKGIGAMSNAEYAANKDAIAEAYRLGKIKE